MIPLAVMLLQDAYCRARRLRREEMGASVIEWALIAAVSVLAVSIIAVVVVDIVNKKSSDLNDCATQVGSSACK